MTTIRTVILVFIVGIVLAGCNQERQSPLPAQPVPKAPDLSKDVSKLKVDLLSLQIRMDAVEAGEASVSTDEQGYGVAKTQFGAFTISTKTVTPFLDGFKVMLRIGNLTSANFHGAKITVSWGPPFDVNNVEDYVKNQKKKEFSVTNQFTSGAFTDVEFALTPAKPQEVKTLSVGIKLDQIVMRVR